MHTWAFVAHSCSRGPTNSRKRLPAVIRINARTISLDADSLTAHSWKASGPVTARAAEVISGFDIGFPRWVPLHVAALSHGGAKVLGVCDSSA